MFLCAVCARRVYVGVALVRCVFGLFLFASRVVLFGCFIRLDFCVRVFQNSVVFFSV